MIYPDNKKFAFTIFDDTDNATVENIKPVYDLLHELGIYTTKSVWPLQVKDYNCFTGNSLQDLKYLDFIKNLKNKGFEIGLHNVGSGNYTRNEIEFGLEEFNRLLGNYPKVHVNHSSNTDNIYWGSKRFIFPFNMIYKIFNKKRYLGEEELSMCFWGDLHKKYIKYTRNHTFKDLNTSSNDSNMPYYEASKLAYSNYWFSSSDAANINEFNKVTSLHNVDRLEKERGVCILYTHFASGFVVDGKLNSEFEANMRYIASKEGFFVPVSNLLDYMLEKSSYTNSKLNFLDKIKLDFKWFLSKLKK